MQIPFVDFKRQYQDLKKEIESEVGEILGSGRYILGEKMEDFENRFAKFCHSKYSLGVNNGTSALVLALAALDLKPGDEVITQPNTFIATVEAILWAKAKPVFVDINPATYNLDIGALERAVTKKTKAILPVHLFGQMSDMAPILKVAKKHNLFVVEDCAQAHGAEYKGRRAGSLGDIGCFSFYPTKVLGACGEGGAVVTSNKLLAEKMRRLRDHGSKVKYLHEEMGFNFRLEAIQGAILSIKLKHLDKWITKRRQLAESYDRSLKDLPIILPFNPDFSRSVYYVYVIRTKNRKRLQDYLAREGVSTMIHYPFPIHLQKAGKSLGYMKGDFPEAEKAAQEILSLPFFPELEETEQKYVIDRMHDFFAKNSIK